MNFRELINKLDHINEAEGSLTLQSIAAAEKAAMDKATAEKTKGGWTGFTTWDPRTAGNIALAKLAQQHHFEGLFNSEGDFVIAFGDNMWSSQGDGNGTAPRIAPPTPADWKPLAAKGLIPQNAKGPAELTNWLTSGGAQKEFDAVKKQSADAAAGTVDASQAPKITSADEEAKMTQLEGLVDQYLKLKEDIKTGAKTVKGPEGKTDTEKKAEVGQAAKVTPSEPATGTGIKLPPGAENPIGAALSKRVADLDPTGSKVDYRLDPEGKAKLNAMNESSIAQSLVESFGYQKKTPIAELVENLVRHNNNLYELFEAEDDLNLSSKYEKNKDTKSKKDDDDFNPDAYLQSKYGDADNTKSGRVDRRTWKEKNVITTVPNAIWKEGTLSWEDEIIPGVYSFKDLAIDLGIAAGLVLVGTIMAPFTAGASLGANVAGGLIIVRWLIRLARGIQSMIKIWGKPYWELIKLNPTKAANAVSAALKVHADAFRKALAEQLGPKAFFVTFLITIGWNGLAELIKEYFPNVHKAITKGVDTALDTIQPGIDWARKKTGLEEGL